MRYFILVVLVVNILFSKEYIIGFAQDTLANDWREAQVIDVQNEVAKYPNLKLIVKDAKGKVSNQIRDIQRFIDQDVDFILTSPKNAKITSLVLKKAIKKNIKVILISRTITTDDYTAFVAPDNYMIGLDAGKFLANYINYKGTILMLEGVQGASSTLQRGDGFMDAVSKYKNINVIKKSANYLRNDAIKVMEKLYKDDVKFDAIYSHSDSMLIGARNVMERLKKTIVPSVGIDYIKQTQRAIKDGKQIASFLYPTSGKEGVRLIVDIIDGKKVQKDTILGTIMITKENVDKIDPIF
ncbi:MAG: substrate-binding domain-containing protein [Campylobacterota bacterium]|nr:substrate-binding domain-containing protein [Campylobacterota bacterium]